jgi:hypothetical protein
MVAKVEYDDRGIDVTVESDAEADAVIQACNVAKRCFPQSVRPNVFFKDGALGVYPTKITPLPEHTKRAAAVIKALLEIDGETCTMGRVEGTETKVRNRKEGK